MKLGQWSQYGRGMGQEQAGPGIRGQGRFNMNDSQDKLTEAESIFSRFGLRTLNIPTGPKPLNSELRVK